MKNSKKSLWPMALIIAFSLYLFAAPVAMAAPKETVSQNTTRDEKATVSQNTIADDSRSAVQNTKPDAGGNPGQDTEPDTVSTADEFKAWLESHKNGGGGVKLTNDIVLKEFYFFVPNGANLPDIIVDTDTYTITAAGNISFFSDGHLIFRGKAGDGGIFRARRGGMLTLDGVIVEGSAEGTDTLYAVWQEEGAGLLLGNTFVECRVSGEIHYADMPFVTESASACVVVEKEQSAAGLLPTQIKCNVNYQGQIRYNEPTSVAWDLAGTEEHQEKRRRFQAQGFSSQAVFEVPPVCTVVYNDYPLTFTEVSAFMRDTVYYFQGDYTKPKGAFPLDVTAEYSFDNTSWIEGEKRTVTDDREGFQIYFSRDEWDKVQNPYIYIRLQGKKDDKTYFSNVLQYQANNMAVAEDLGGNRGGGTSIVNPPDEPKDEDSGGTSSGDRKPSGNQKPSENHKSSHDSGSGNYQDQESSDDASDTDAFSGSDSSGDQAAGQDITQNVTDTSASPNGSVPGSADDGNPTATDIPEKPNDENNDFGVEEADAETSSKGTVEVISKELAAPASDEEGGDVSKHRQMPVNQRLDTTKNIVFVAGFVTLSAGAGVAGYFAHASSLRRHKRSRTISPKGKNRTR